MTQHDGSPALGQRSADFPDNTHTEHLPTRVVVARVRLTRAGAIGPRPKVARHRVSPAAELHGVRVLVVAEDIDVQTAVKLHFESCGAFVGVASSCSGARASLAVREWDLLVVDVGLPDGSGYDLARFARSLRRPPTCVALLGSESREDLDAARRVGFQLHLRKPCEPTMLAEVVDRFRRASTGGTRA